MVTGTHAYLPAEQYVDKEEKDALQEEEDGVHVAEGREVKVDCQQPHDPGHTQQKQQQNGSHQPKSTRERKKKLFKVMCSGS